MTDAAAAPAAPTPAPAPAPAAAPSAAPEKPAVSSPAPGATPAPEVAPNLIADAKGEAEPAKPAEVKVDEAKPADAKAPLFPDLKLPEGVKADDPTIGQFKQDFADAGLSSEQVQKLVDKYGGKLMLVAEVQKAFDAQAQLWKDTQQQWVDKVKADPEVGGANLQTNLAGIGKLIDRFGGKESVELRKAFGLTGAGNHPEIVRFFTRIAKATNLEGSTVTGGKPAPTTFKSAASTLYGNGKADA